MLPVPPSAFSLEVLAPARPPQPALDGEGIEFAFSRHARNLRRAFAGASRVLIVVSDATRKTGSPQFLPVLVRALHDAGATEVGFAVASGIHRSPTRDEVAAILGPELEGRYPMLLHDPDDPDVLEKVGTTRAGTPVCVHRALRDHDRIVLTGAVGFHYYAGFSGGRKAVVPGLAGRETVSRNHLRALRADGSRHPRAIAGCLSGNPVHLDMADGAALVGPHLLVNTVVRPLGGIERLFIGDWRRAHFAACRYLRTTRTVPVEPRDLVIAAAGGEPGDINLIQAHKAFEAAVPALRPGGLFILVARCREGAGHEDFMPFFDHPDEKSMVRALRQEFRVYRQTALAWRRKARSCRMILVSGLGKDVARRLDAMGVSDLEEAIAIARGLLPSGTPGWLIPQAPRWLLVPRS
jgi:nickel-dependent lactate racemase